MVSLCVKTLILSRGKNRKVHSLWAGKIHYLNTKGSALSYGTCIVKVYVLTVVYFLDYKYFLRSNFPIKSIYTATIDSMVKYSQILIKKLIIILKIS